MCNPTFDMICWLCTFSVQKPAAKQSGIVIKSIFFFAVALLQQQRDYNKGEMPVLTLQTPPPPSSLTLSRPTPCLLLLTANPLTLPPVHAHASALSSPHRPHQRLTWSALSTLPVCHVLPTPYTCRRRQVRSCNPPPHRYTNHVGRHAITNQARRHRCSGWMAAESVGMERGVCRWEW